eukprot:TRINITY_DN5783_c0_g2_i1.p1 TRINITY_DN5783_c0_g2~~TRINITY_DN5783_c0_g2_i1.p1  ORF type:complete len:198 (-),score=26.46 TRINITY_DN5783_c0_g2_i1:115-708(-)
MLRQEEEEYKRKAILDRQEREETERKKREEEAHSHVKRDPRKTIETFRSSSNLSGKICGVCHKDLFSSGMLVRVGGIDIYHIECFTCTQCKCMFDKVYWQYRGKPYCFEHYCVQQNLWCAACGNLIDTQVIQNAMGKTWHPHCFMCRYCKRPFGNSEHFVFEGKPYCSEHFGLVSGAMCAKCNGVIQPHEQVVQARF